MGVLSSDRVNVLLQPNGLVLFRDEWVEEARVGCLPSTRVTVGLEAEDGIDWWVGY